jgi:proteasome lid subunit RPN8/RPN11
MLAISHCATVASFGREVELRTCSAEDLIVLKLFASRPLDLHDAEGGAIRQKGKLDWTYMEEPLRPLSEVKEQPENDGHAGAVAPAMIRIPAEPWQAMLSHARQTYPNECCGAMLGSINGLEKIVRVAWPLENAFHGLQAARYEIRPQDLLAAAQSARERHMDLIGIYHSHPDGGAYFSRTDLQNSCPWYSFVVLSIQKGEFHHANSWLPNAEQTAAAQEELIY